MGEKSKYMGFMSNWPAKKDSMKQSESDNRFARPNDFSLELSLNEHLKRIWTRNSVSMDKLSK